MSVLELVIATALAGIVLAAVFPFLNFSPNALRADAQELSAVLTSAWSLSTSRVTHYRVRVASPTEFVLERGQLVGSTWVFTVERTVPLHSGIQFVAADVTAACGTEAGRCAEFHSRGGLVGVTALDLGPIFTLTDTRRGWTRQIKVWGTGLVEML